MSEIGSLIISRNAVLKLKELQRKLKQADKHFTTHYPAPDVYSWVKDTWIAYDEFLDEFLEIAKIDLETVKPSFTRSIKNKWRDIKLFYR